MSRQVITKVDVDDAREAGKQEIQLESNAIVTSLANEHAKKHGVKLVRQGDSRTDPITVDTSGPDTQAVRDAVIAALGHEPEQLDSIIAKVTGS